MLNNGTIYSELRPSHSQGSKTDALSTLCSNGRHYFWLRGNENQIQPKLNVYLLNPDLYSLFILSLPLSQSLQLPSELLLTCNVFHYYKILHSTFPTAFHHPIT